MFEKYISVLTSYNKILQCPPGNYRKKTCYDAVSEAFLSVRQYPGIDEIKFHPCKLDSTDGYMILAERQLFLCLENTAPKKAILEIKVVLTCAYNAWRTEMQLHMILTAN